MIRLRIDGNQTVSVRGSEIVIRDGVGSHYPRCIRLYLNRNAMLAVAIAIIGESCNADDDACGILSETGR